MITYDAAAAIRTLTADEGVAMWHHFATLLDPRCSDHVADEHRDELLQMIKGAAVYLDLSDEHLGLFPIETGPRSFVWLSMQKVELGGPHARECCMAEEDAEVEFLHAQRYR